jgi:Tol biopolymer transport system component
MPKTLYFANGSKPEELRIYSMPALGGEQQPVTDPITREPALSHDGSKITYVKRYLSPDGGFEKHQICMKSLNRGESVSVCEVSGKNWLHSPIWSPDGNKIAFLSSGDRGGNRHHQIWIADVSAETKPGSPVKFELPGQTANLLAGWTQNNRIGILVPTEKKTHLYTVPATGGKATQLTTGYACMPVWSPDNSRIYFDGDHGGFYASLEYVAAEGGQVNRIEILPDNLQPAFPSEIAVSNDGSKLLFAGFYRHGKAEPPGRLFTVSVDGGEVTPLKIAGGENRPSGAFSPEWSPDEDQIAFIAAEEIKPDFNVYNIFVMPAAGGEAQRISSQEDRVARGTIAWSPDGISIAFYTEDNTLRLIPANGGKSKVLVSEVGDGIPWSGIAWSPDGKKIAYTAGGDLHVVARDGDDPKKIQTGLDARHLKIDWARDGKHIAFTAVQGGEPELWLMEDFLPTLEAKK